MNLEAAKTMRFGGLAAQEAIKLVTLYPAIQIGLDDRIGSIDVGKDGDFAVYDRHPLDTFAKNVLTVIEGDVWFVHPSIDLEDIRPGPASEFEPTPPRSPLDIAASPDGFYAIIGATVHPVASVPIENGVIVMRNGLISAVGQDFTPPEGTMIIRAHGLHVYPGLIDAVSQIGLREIDALAVTVDSRDIADFQPELRTLSAVNPFSAHIGVARCEGITTTGVFPSGGYISGRGGLIQLDGWSMPDMLRGVELGLVMDLPSLPARYEGDDRGKRLDDVRTALEHVERFVTDARSYAEAKGTESDIVVDVRLEAMIPYVTSDKPVFFRADSYKEILEAVHFAETFNLDPVIVGGGDAWKCAEMLAEKEIPVILTSVFNLPFDPMDPFDAYYAGPAKLEAAGVDFCIATDDSAYARRLPLHAGMAVAHGLSEEKAIGSITLDAAEILRVDFELGSLEVGKVADVIITTGNPCQASTRTVGMFLAGVPTELTSLHEEHHEKWSNRPRPGVELLGELHGPPPMRLNEIEGPVIEKTP
jgi:imidazolonepropionase-like amidohydrolase